MCLCIRKKFIFMYFLSYYKPCTIDSAKNHKLLNNIPSQWWKKKINKKQTDNVYKNLRKYLVINFLARFFNSARFFALSIVHGL